MQSSPTRRHQRRRKISRMQANEESRPWDLQSLLGRLPQKKIRSYWLGFFSLDAPQFRENCFCAGLLEKNMCLHRLLASFFLMAFQARVGFAVRPQPAKSKRTEIALPATTCGRRRRCFPRRAGSGGQTESGLRGVEPRSWWSAWPQTEQADPVISTLRMWGRRRITPCGLARMAFWKARAGPNANLR